ncbi:MAG: GyrI-like domain-containing protein [Bacteroidota bacterium]
MKILKIIGLVLLGIIVIACVYAAVLPSTYTVERSTVINSDEASVWTGINKFSSFKQWNPWGKLDTTAKITLGGEDGTVGSSYAWDSQNEDVGAGIMTITNVLPAKMNEYELKFTKPWESVQQCKMAMEKAEGGYKVSWSMTGEQNFIMKLMGIFVGGMDGMIGKDFEAGLAELKKLTEGGTFKTEAAMPSYDIADYDYPATLYAAIRSKVAFQDIPNFFSTNFGTIMTGTEKAGLKVSGTPSGIYYMYDEKAGMADMAAALPVDKEAKIEGVSWIQLEGKKAHKIDYYGDYKNMMPAYVSMSKYLATNNLGSNPELVIEEYITDPMTEKDTAKWHTRILFFTK